MRVKRYSINRFLKEKKSLAIIYKELKYKRKEFVIKITFCRSNIDISCNKTKNYLIQKIYLLLFIFLYIL